MKLVNAKYNLIIEFKENMTPVLIIENPKAMEDIISNIWAQVNGQDGDFILSSEKEIRIEKQMDCIINPFAIDFNSKKIINSLYSRLSKIANTYVVEKNDINVRSVELIDKILL
ncbi:MAG: type II-A CRISPR-associated protein Csn2, partial [Lachnospiraceae bacterium]|nr:type II-A CRISPR-associated protein Csn2 [Lachnospiraceae bacterium]